MKSILYRMCLPALLCITAVSGFAQTHFTVSGQLTLPNQEIMANFAILVSGAENKVVYTDNNGHYTVSLSAGGAYEIKPLDCGSNALNGVTTFDLVLISMHILGESVLNSPYQIIASDADNSNSVAIVDSTIFRELILGILPDIPGGNFRFVPKNYVFPNPQDPFNPPFPQSVTIASLDADQSGLDFYGIKMGDVNNTALTFPCNDPELPALLSGRVYRDANENCAYDNNEDGMQSWVISASDGVNTFFGTSNAMGEYQIQCLPGVYSVILNNPNGFWTSCADTITGVSAGLQSPGVADFGLIPAVLSSDMQVDLSTPRLRRCFSNYYTVHYCNNGTVTAPDARVEIHFDSFLTVLSSEIPWNSINGNTYTFPLGDVEPGDCADFSILYKVSCNAVLGQTHCTEAQIFPAPEGQSPMAWSGPEIKVRGYCNGANVQFVITNRGADMLQPASYIVVEDIVVMAPPVNNPFTLASLATEIITVPANGATWRLEAQQAPGYPWGQVASATVEGCGLNPQGGFSTGYVNQFPLDDQQPDIDIDCQENVGSFDPNDKQGFPKGVLDEHYIPLQEPITYLIRFQNTGTDTAFTVAIRDTLDADLDASTLVPLGSSHPYTFNLSGEGVAQFVFANILLPDSNVNEAASHGYVKFSIQPKKDRSNGTLVENQAAIYFDFNEPVITNKTRHTLGEKYLDVSNVVFQPGVTLQVYPNPATERAVFLLESPQPMSNGSLRLYDMQGREVRVLNFEHNQFLLDCKTLDPGVYGFSIYAGGLRMAAGKLVIAD